MHLVLIRRIVVDEERGGEYLMRRSSIVMLAFAMSAIFVSATTLPATTQTTKTTVQRITVIDYFSHTITDNAFGIYLGKTPTWTSEFYFNFEPTQPFVGVTHVDISVVLSAAGLYWGGSDTIRYVFATETINGEVGLNNVIPRAFNHDGVVTSISEGMNELTITMEDYELWLHRLELFIEYEYLETSPPPMVEVSYPELLMVLGLTLVIAYNVYNKLKPRFNKAPETDQSALLGRWRS
jgi:hypothetical protein